MIIIDDVRSLNDRYIFLKGDRQVSTNYADLLEIYQKAGARATEYNGLCAALSEIDDSYLAKVRECFDSRDTNNRIWDETKDVRYKWDAEDAHKRATEYKYMSDGADAVIKRIRQLADHYYKLKTMSYNIMRARGWL